MKERLQKVIASAGIASRRKAEELIVAGAVIVNGKKITELGSQADIDADTITVNGKPLRKPIAITYLINKPRNVVTSKVRQGSSKIVTDFVPSFPAVHPVGRLDKESEGLLLLTNDGDLTNRLTHPSFEHTKEYRVEVVWKDGRRPEPSVTGLEERFKKGISLSDGKVFPDKIKVLSNANNTRILIITIHEGKHHLIRRMCATVGYKVKRLQRTALGSVRNPSLKPGDFKVLNRQEQQRLFINE